MVVEDEDLVRQYVVTQLRTLGYSVLAVESGPEALEALDRHPEVSLLLTDVVMPGGMYGTALAGAARRLRPGLDVLFTSGYSENALMQSSSLNPVWSLLRKPYNRAELAAKIRQVLDESGKRPR